MKIAISSSADHLESQLDPRFGRCGYFLVVDTDNMGFEDFPNHNASMGGGAGIQSAQFIASKGVQAVITDRCGPNAFRTLQAAGIDLYVAQEGVIRDLVNKFKKGQLRPVSEANAPIHAGTGGRGMGRGRGMHGGRGMGRGGGMGRNL